MSGPGRPKELKDGEIVSLYIEKSLIEVLDGIASREKKSRSKIVMEALLPYLKAHARDNFQFALDHWQIEEVTDFRAFPTLGEDPERYLAGIDAGELADLKVQTRKWDVAVSSKIEAKREDRWEAPEQPACPYNCGLPILAYSVYPYDNLKVHLFNHHRDQAVKDGLLKY